MVKKKKSQWPKFKSNWVGDDFLVYEQENKKSRPEYTLNGREITKERYEYLIKTITPLNHS